MNSDRQNILSRYISYLYTTGRSYDFIGRYIRHVSDFLEKSESVSRKGYISYKRENADLIARYPILCDAICDLLAFLGIGYKKKEVKVRSLEKLSSISERNRELLNSFILWLTENNDYSPHTVDIYYTSLKQYFEYANGELQEVYTDFGRAIVIPADHPFADYCLREVFQMAKKADRA